jgi:hypothetical protein
MNNLSMTIQKAELAMWNEYVFPENGQTTQQNIQSEKN